MFDLACWYQLCYFRVMAYKSPYDGPLKLELVDDSPPARGVPVDAENAAPDAAPPAIAAQVTRFDTFLAEATREFDEGRIDQPLWMRAVTQANGDETSARAAYLRARATALQVRKRDKRADRRSRTLREMEDSTADRETYGREASSVVGGAARSYAQPWNRSRKAIVATVGSLVVILGLLVLYNSGNSMQAPVDGAAATSAPRPGSATRVEKSRAEGSNAAGKASDEDVAREFASRIQELKDAGNWNVLVLHASAWTRKQPANAVAWSELSLGYANMRQQDDALAAARKAVELAPKEALYWRNLGQLDLEADDAVDALRAFEEATRWNDSDAYSFVQVGILNARLDRLPEAKVAFDRALALRNDDADARCGAAWIAQRQARPKETKAASGQAKPSEGQCRELVERASAAVALKGPIAFKVAPTVAR